jgi:hypothetical protein
MRKLLRTKKGKALAALFVLALIAAVAAFAMWKVGAEGRGTGKSGRLIAPTVAAASDTDLANVEGDLLPGGDGSLWVNINNPNTSPLYVRDVRAGNHNSHIIPSDPTSCPSTNLSFANGYLSGGVFYDGEGLPAIPPASNVLFRLPRIIHLAADAPDGCQGITFLVEGQSAGQNGIIVDFQTAAP